jgi:hypothetical protein
MPTDRFLKAMLAVAGPAMARLWSPPGVRSIASTAVGMGCNPCFYADCCGAAGRTRKPPLMEDSRQANLQRIVCSAYPELFSSAAAPGVGVHLALFLIIVIVVSLIMAVLNTEEFLWLRNIPSPPNSSPSQGA